MKPLATMIVALFASATQALAAAGETASAWNGFIVTFFLTFAATVFIFQLLPGAALFVGLIKGLIGGEGNQVSPPKTAAPNSARTP
jgi:hypothetical protein